MAGHEAEPAVREPQPPAAEGRCWQGLATAEAKRLVRLAGPMVASCFLQNAVNIVSLMFVGHLGELHLAGVSLAISITSATGLNIIVRAHLFGLIVHLLAVHYTS
jgi:MATE family multidrug resistance protein